MAIVDLKNVLKIFGDEDSNVEDQNELYKELMLMTLARAASADTNMKKVEVELVRKLISREVGQEVSVADVRVAGSSELYETTPLNRYLAKAAGKLTAKQRVTIANSLAEIIRSDEQISHFEVEFFEMVAKALNLTRAELAGLSNG